MFVDIRLIIIMWSRRLVILFLFNIILTVNTKRYETRCKLVRELLRAGVGNDSYLGQWVCLIEKVSNRDTRALVTSSNGKKSYGLYQIPSQWCKEGKPGGQCNIRCESLIDDDIRDDTECATIIYHNHGFKYWSKWVTRCKNNIDFFTQEIYKCPDLISPRSSPERITHSDILRNSDDEVAH